MKEVALSEMKDDLSRYLRQAAKEEIVITRHGKAAGVLIGFDSEDDWFDYRLETDPRFLDRVAAARASLRGGHGVRLEDIDDARGPNQTTDQSLAKRRARIKRTTSRRRGVRG